MPRPKSRLSILKVVLHRLSRRLDSHNALKPSSEILSEFPQYPWKGHCVIKGESDSCSGNMDALECLLDRMGKVDMWHEFWDITASAKWWRGQLCACPKAVTFGEDAL